MLYVAGSLVSLPLLFGVWTLAGCGVERAFGLSAAAHDDGLAWLRRFGLGASAWVLALFALAVFQALSPWAIWSLVAVSLFGGAATLLANRGRGRPALERPLVPSPSATHWIRHLGTGALAIAIGSSGVVLALQALRPDISWDANVYHLTLPRLYLEHGGFFRVPWNVYSNWPLGMEMLFGAAMALRDYGLAKLVHFGFGGLTAIAVFRLAGKRSGLWAVAALLFNPVVLYEIRIAYVDLGYAFFLLLGAASLSAALDAEPGSRLRHRELLLAGIAGGTLCAVKLNGFFGPAVLVAAWGLEVVVVERRWRRGWIRELAALLFPAFALGAPWWLKSWAFTGNPLYPLLWDWFGGPEWSTRLAAAHGQWQRAIGMGREPFDFLLLPLRVILEGDLGYQHFDGQISRAWIVLVPIAIAGARRDRLSRRLLVIAVLFFGLWAATSQQMRLLIPILPLLAVAAARALGRGFEAMVRDRRMRPRLAAATEALVSVAFASLLITAGLVYTRQAPRLARDLATHGRALQQAVVHPVYSWIDSQLPADARLLLINTNHGFFLHRDYVADSFFEASQIADAFLDTRDKDAAVARARELGITHALVENRPGPAYPDSLVEVLRDPAWSTTLYASPDRRFTVLALSGPPPRQPVDPVDP